MDGCFARILALLTADRHRIQQAKSATAVVSKTIADRVPALAMGTGFGFRAPGGFSLKTADVPADTTVLHSHRPLHRWLLHSASLGTDSSSIVDGAEPQRRHEQAHAGARSVG